MPNLLYIYTKSSDYMQKDYEFFDIKSCFFLHSPDLIPYSILSFFESHGGYKSLTQIAESFQHNSEIDNGSNSVYLQKIKQDIVKDGSILTFCQMLVDLHGINNPLIIDLSDCPSEISPFLYYMLLNSKNSGITAIVWNRTITKPQKIPLFILEPAAKSFARLIALGYQTIPAIQCAYVSRKIQTGQSWKHKEKISQPTVSKYLSKLKKQGVITSHFEKKKKIFTIAPEFSHLF
ncbi:hypothetical protein [Candidatus Lokiarchaeum ossiferum]|uniref:hypothetical protein n=1 Tax=Candidatus Lokiarchaeum ossiferum TaxID=2951803 RepID=UPI00352ECB3A